MAKKQTLQALFFDFDGVLIDSNLPKTEAFRTLFKDYDTKTIEEIVSYHQLHGGISRVEKIRHVHKQILKQPLTDKELARWSAKYSQLVVEKVVTVDWISGAKEFLDSIRGALPIFVISGTPEDELRYIIERRKISGYFREILGSPIKKPVHIRNLLFGYRLDPGACIFVGDALTDCNAAAETGLQFVGIQGEITFPERTTVLPDCRELQKVIAGNFQFPRRTWL